MNGTRAHYEVMDRGTGLARVEAQFCQEVTENLNPFVPEAVTLLDAIRRVGEHTVPTIAAMSIASATLSSCSNGIAGAHLRY